MRGGKSGRARSLDVVEAYGRDVLTGNAPGLSLADLIEVAITEAVQQERERIHRWHAMTSPSEDEVPLPRKRKEGGR